MAQRQEKTSKEKEKDKFGELRKKLNEVTKPKKKEKRKVRLLFETCCGCGCNTETIIREVEDDSPLQDGDIATDFIDGDRFDDEDDE
jgi:hypothetical protein